MMQKLREIVEWIQAVVISFIAGWMVYLLIASIYPVVITEFMHPHIMPPEVKAGEVVYYKNHFIRKYVAFGEVARVITNDKGFQEAADLKFLISGLGEHDVSTPIEIPRWLPPGEYTIQFFHRWYLSRPLLPLRIIEKQIGSNKFRVVK